MKQLRLTAGALLVSAALSSVAHAATELAMKTMGSGRRWRKWMMPLQLDRV